MSERRQSLLNAIVLGILVALAYVWIGTDGSWREWGGYRRHYYSRLAEAFLNGRLSLLTEPSRGILSQPDPYSMAGHTGRDVLFDAVLFNGKYYLYWGPVPALVEAAVCLVTGNFHPLYNDRPMCVAFAYGMVLVAAILIFQIRDRLFPNQLVSPGAVGVLSLAMGAPILMILANAEVYETAIVAGQFFLLAGILAAWFAISPSLAESPSAANPREKSKMLLLALAGICWAAAAGSRVSLPPAVAALAAITIWHLWTSSPGNRRNLALPAISALAATFIAGAGLLAWYNFARFGSITEFGLRYQLSGQDQSHPLQSGFLGIQNILFNVDAYLATPPACLHVFPLLYATNCRTWMDTHFPLPSYFSCEPLVGILWAQPFLLLAPASALFSPSPANKISLSQQRSSTRWLAASLLAASLLGIAPVLLISGSTMRYLLDFVPCFTILAVLGYWQILERLTPHPRIRRMLEYTVTIVVFAQCVVAVQLTLATNAALLHALF